MVTVKDEDGKLLFNPGRVLGAWSNADDRDGTIIREAQILPALQGVKPGRARARVIHIIEGKGDVQDCGITLMSHFMKLWEKIVDHRLRAITTSVHYGPYFPP